MDIVRALIEQLIKYNFLASSQDERVGRVLSIQLDNGSGDIFGIKETTGGEVIHVSGLTQINWLELAEFANGARGLPVKWRDESVFLIVIPPDDDTVHQWSSYLIEWSLVRRTGLMAPSSSFHLVPELSSDPPYDLYYAVDFYYDVGYDYDFDYDVGYDYD